VFPLKLKRTLVKPLLKAGKKTSCSNYRPIALLSPFSKISEKIFLRRVLGFLNKNSVLAADQFGYKKGISCIDAIIKLNDIVVQCKRKKLIVLSIFLDLSKAFDCVSHSTLLDIVERQGIRGVAYDLLKSYLSDRVQAVAVPSKSGEQLSDFKPIKSGVPQGSVYGPYLFIMYINCLYSVINGHDCKCVLYVDDTNLIIEGESIECVRRKAVLITKAIYDLFASLNLALNLDKTNYMIFNNEQVDLDLCINNVKISPASSCRFLGLTIAPNLSWKPHISNVIRKVYKGIFVLKQTSSSLGKRYNLLVYNAFIQSHLSYGVLVWGGEAGNLTLLSVLFRKQKRAIRLLNRINDPKVSCRGLFKKDGIMTLAGLFIYYASIFAKNHLSLRMGSSIHDYNTRNKNKIFVKRYTSGDIAGKSTQIFNKLPTNIRQACSSTAFKKQLKNYVIEREPYTLAEFIE